MELYKLLSGPPSGRDLLSKLPSELKRRVLDFVDFEDHLNIRLLSRVWSITAFERTWSHGLILRPNRNHVPKLIEVSRRPWLRERIDKIVFSVDDIDYIVVRHGPKKTFKFKRFASCRTPFEFEMFFKQYANILDRKWIRSSSSPEIKQYVSDVAKLNSDFHRIFSRPSPCLKPESFGPPQGVINPDDDYCDAKLLARTLTVMSNVKTIHIKFGEYPFPDPSLTQPWYAMPKQDGVLGRYSTIQDQILAVRSYSSILMGANVAALPFTTLRMDRMPVLCFVPPDEAHIDSPLNHLATMRNSVRHVQNLDVEFSGCYLDYTDTESLTIPHNLALFLGSMPLRILALRWGATFDTHDSRSKLLDLSSPFYDLTFPHLTTLRVSHVAPVTHMTPTLHRFLTRHSSTLRRLHIKSTVKPSLIHNYHPRECRCVWKRTIFKMRDTLKLQKLELLLLRDDKQRIYDDEWNEIEDREKSDAKKLERFVLGSRDEPWSPSRGHINGNCPLVRAGDLGGENIRNMAVEEWYWDWDVDGDLGWDD